MNENLSTALQFAWPVLIAGVGVTMGYGIVTGIRDGIVSHREHKRLAARWHVGLLERADIKRKFKR